MYPNSIWRSQKENESKDSELYFQPYSSKYAFRQDHQLVNFNLPPTCTLSSPGFNYAPPTQFEQQPHFVNIPIESKISFFAIRELSINLLSLGTAFGLATGVDVPSDVWKVIIGIMFEVHKDEKYHFRA
jgi:hypothetical protein